jgi:hypothetical protein
MKIVLTCGALALMIASNPVSAGAFEELEQRQEIERLGQKENCGSQPPAPGLIGSLYNSPEKRAVDEYYSCGERNSRRDYLKSTQEMQAIVTQASTSCQNAIRKLSANPSTLSFDSINSFDWIHGLNGSNVNFTDGGYSSRISGSSIGGRFVRTCYMDNGYKVGNVR